MIGTIERIKNSVLLKCNNLNDDIISKTLGEIIDTKVYWFCEEITSMLGSVGAYTEEDLRELVKDKIKTPIIKKVKRKLFIDSLALQITNDSFIEDNLTGKTSIDEITGSYVKELRKNKNSNQLNMTEDLNLSEIINNLRIFVNGDIIKLVNESATLSNSIFKLVDDLQNDLQTDLEKLIDETDEKYKAILIDELSTEKENKGAKEEKGDENMFDNLSINEDVLDVEEKSGVNKFDKYDDMTLFNKMTLSLNTEEEKLSRLESQLQTKRQEVDSKLTATNKNIEANIERENNLSKRKIKLDDKEVELNSKLSETEVIFLNMKPLINGLNKIKDSNDGGNINE